MDEPVTKRVDESWKEQAEREKQAASAQAGQGPTASTPSRARAASEEAPQPRFDLFVSGLAMEGFVALGDLPHPTTHRQAADLPHAKYLIDLLGVLSEKTRGNLSADEEKLLKDALYQLRMRYLSKAGGPTG